MRLQQPQLDLKTRRINRDGQDKKSNDECGMMNDELKARRL
jgi:hypothetical protein